MPLPAASPSVHCPKLRSSSKQTTAVMQAAHLSEADVGGGGSADQPCADCDWAAGREEEGCYYEQVDPDGPRHRQEEERGAAPRPSSRLSQVAVNLTPAATAAAAPNWRGGTGALLLFATLPSVCVCSAPTPPTPAPIERPPFPVRKRANTHDTYLPLAPSFGNLWLTAVLSRSIAQVVAATPASRFALETYRVSSLNAL